MPSNQDSAPILVKRYAGRRLYDATHGRYVSLPALRAMAADGVALEVIDAATGADIKPLLLDDKS